MPVIERIRREIGQKMKSVQETNARVRAEREALQSRVDEAIKKEREKQAIRRAREDVRRAVHRSEDKFSSLVGVVAGRQPSEFQGGMRTRTVVRKGKKGRKTIIITKTPTRQSSGYNHPFGFDTMGGGRGRGSSGRFNPITGRYE